MTRRGAWAAVIIVAMVLGAVWYFSPSTSPSPGVRDSDNDGVPDASDQFPSDPAESHDTDGDGVGDNGDAFPEEPAESADADGDGVGDNADFFDAGNGAIRIAITDFAMTNMMSAFAECDPSRPLPGVPENPALDESLCDPYVRYRVWQEDHIEPLCTKNSAPTWDDLRFTDTLDHFMVCDVPDDEETIRYRIVVFDKDTDYGSSHDHSCGAQCWWDDILDYVPESDDTYNTHTLARPFAQQKNVENLETAWNAVKLEWIVETVAA